MLMLWTNELAHMSKQRQVRHLCVILTDFRWIDVFCAAVLFVSVFETQNDQMRTHFSKLGFAHFRG
jgi:hypothetical protein